MTKRLYYTQPTLTEFEATIVEQSQAEQGVVVRLDRTAFYPTSGGQPHDTGTLDNVPVKDVWDDEQGHIWHLLPTTADNVQISRRVSGHIDWGRRFDHMQQHTGQHLLSAAFIEVFEANTIGFHLGSISSTIDLDIATLSWDEAARVEDEVNAIVFENRSITLHFATNEALADIPLRKPPQVTGKVRVVWVEDYDASACGGTHVDRTGAVGLIKITGIERYKGGVRVSFLCGERALQDYGRVLNLARETGNALTVGQDEIPEAVTRLLDEVKATRRALNRANDELAHYEAQALWEATPEVNGVRSIVAHWSDRDFMHARTVAGKLCEQPHTLALLAVSEEKGARLVCARSMDLSNIDAAKLLRAAVGALGGRGGGNPTLAQGGAPHHSPETIITVLNQALADFTKDVAN